MKYSEILQLNKELGDNLNTTSYDITLLSNIIVHQIKEILEYQLRNVAINANVGFGDYDNIVQDSQKYNSSNAAIIFWELCNIIEGLPYRIELLKEKEINSILEKTKSEIDFVLKNFENISLLLINKFTSLPFSNSNLRKTKLDELANQLNNYLESKISSKIALVDIDKVFASVGVEKSLVMRYYYSSKSLYTIDFFNTYTEYIKPYFLSVNGKAKKILIFDCDNTLWKGILGEDGFNNIEMSNATNDGAIFSEIQSIALALNKHGILIGLCSKNNPVDVDKVIKSHPDMQLRNEHITISKINWADKVANLKELAEELNIGLDSLVFVDDSPFEVNMVRDHLPEITVLQVPEKLYEYPKMLSENLGLFYNFTITPEDKKKVEMYKQQVNRETVKTQFIDIEDYLASLELKMTIHQNDKTVIARMAQMSQKTNQFNLTTKRYTESDMNNYIDDDNSNVYAFSVADKFGDSGITGLCIITSDGDSKTAEIDTFLMSCRIIGRNVEYAFLDYVIEKIKAKKITDLKAKYIKTPKNEQVKDFFNGCSFGLIDENDSIKNYNLTMNTYVPKQLGYIKVFDGR